MSNDPVKAGDGAIETIRDFVIREAAYEQAKAAYNESRKAVLNLLPKEIGEQTRKVEDFELTIKYPEKVQWDATQLDALFGSDKPIYVKAAYKIDLRDLRKLPEAEQLQLKNCHTVVAGTPSIDIAKAV